MMKLEKDENLDKAVSFEAEPKLTDGNEEDKADTNLSEHLSDSDDSFEMTVYNGNDEEESDCVQEEKDKIEATLISISGIILIIVMIVFLFFLLKWLIGMGFDNDGADNTVWEQATTAASTAAGDKAPEEEIEEILEALMQILKRVLRVLLPLCFTIVVFKKAIEIIKR